MPTRLSSKEGGTDPMSSHKWYHDVSWKLLTFAIVGYGIFLYLVIRELNGAWWQ